MAVSTAATTEAFESGFVARERVSRPACPVRKTMGMLAGGVDVTRIYRLSAAETLGGNQKNRHFLFSANVFRNLASFGATTKAQ
jgi:hypothetical protein